MRLELYVTELASQHPLSRGCDELEAQQILAIHLQLYCHKLVTQDRLSRGCDELEAQQIRLHQHEALLAHSQALLRRMVTAPSIRPPPASGAPPAEAAAPSNPGGCALVAVRRFICSMRSCKVCVSGARTSLGLNPDGLAPVLTQPVPTQPVLIRPVLTRPVLTWPVLTQAGPALRTWRGWRWCGRRIASQRCDNRHTTRPERPAR
eukprot:3588788-Pyramimonas_sp.AAC.1